MELKLFGRQIHIPLNGLNVSRRMEYSVLMKYLNLKGDERLLDIACGDGYWTAKMGAKAAVVIGFDFNFGRLQKARNLGHSRIEVIRCDAHFLPLKNEVFDAAVGICVLEHFDDDVKALSELRRVLNQDAGLALTVDSFSYPNISEEEKQRHAEKFHVRNYYQVPDLEGKLRQAGFKVTSTGYILGTPLSAFLYRLALKFPRLAYFLFPMAYPLSLWSEYASGGLRRNKNGYKLAVSVRAV